MKKRFVAFLLVLIMVLGMLPVSAFAADDGVSPQALNTGHKIDVTFTVLYVGNELTSATITAHLRRHSLYASIRRRTATRPTTTTRSPSAISRRLRTEQL